MKAATGLPAVLLMLSCTTFAQTAPVQPTAPIQQAAPVQPTAPSEQAVPAQQAAAVGESSKPEAVIQPSATSPSTPSPSPTASTPSTEAATAGTDAVPAVPAASVAPAFAPAPFAAGMKIFIAPMNGFEQRVAYSITRKKVPVVLVTERAQADFVLSGIAHVHKRNFFTGFALTTNGYGSVWVEDAHTGKQVFLYKFTRVDANTTVDQDYQNWADSCAGHLKKALEKK